MFKKRFLFTVIMPAYNVEKYIEEAINSVIGQDIGFKENVELIVVDDGTPDLSGTIADSYAKRYWRNIKVIHKENGGLSSARNAGVRIARGDFITFLDGDDTLDLNALSTVNAFLLNDDSNINILTIPVVYFENRNGDHILNNKFENGSRIIDVNQEFDLPQHFVNATFFRTEFAKEYAFKENLRMAISEDAREILNMLSVDPRYAVVVGTKYNYRWRQGSIMNTTRGSKGWYFNHLDTFVEFFINKYYGEMPKYVQYSLMYNLQWKVLLKKSECTALTDEEWLEWKYRCIVAISSFDDDVIMKQRQLIIEHKAFLLNKKHNKYPELVRKGKSIGYTFDGNTIIKRVISINLHITSANLMDNVLTVSGWHSHSLFLSEEPLQVYVKNGDAKIYPIAQEAVVGREAFGELISNKIMFDFSFDVNHMSKLEFFYETEIEDVVCKSIKFDGVSQEDLDMKGICF